MNLARKPNLALVSNPTWRETHGIASRANHRPEDCAGTAGRIDIRTFVTAVPAQSFELVSRRADGRGDLDRNAQDIAQCLAVPVARGAFVPVQRMNCFCVAARSSKACEPIPRARISRRWKNHRSQSRTGSARIALTLSSTERFRINRAILRIKGEVHVAEKLKGEGKPKVKRGDAPSIGHNLSSIKLNGGPFLKRLEKLHDDKESANGEAMADINNVYTDMADKLGIPKKLCRQFFTENRSAQKRAAKLAEMVESEVDTLDMLEAAFGSDSGFGGWAAVQKAAALSKESGGE